MPLLRSVPDPIPMPVALSLAVALAVTAHCCRGDGHWPGSLRGCSIKLAVVTWQLRPRYGAAGLQACDAVALPWVGMAGPGMAVPAFGFCFGYGFGGGRDAGMPVCVPGSG